MHARYVLYRRRGCPPSDQPYEQTPCMTGDAVQVYAGLNMLTTAVTLHPYTNYQFQIQAENEAGTVDFPNWVSTITEPTCMYTIHLQYIY